MTNPVFLFVSYRCGVVLTANKGDGQLLVPIDQMSRDARMLSLTRQDVVMLRLKFSVRSAGGDDLGGIDGAAFGALPAFVLMDNDEQL